MEQAMNVLEAIAKARDEDMCIRRKAWPDEQLLVWKRGMFYINRPQQNVYEAPCPHFTLEAVEADDWEAC
jgi:hypothetical protein